MRYALIALVLTCLARPTGAQDATRQGPSNEKAQKTYKQALEDERKGLTEYAFDNFKKADKQDGGHCVACQWEMIKYGVAFGDWKAAELAAQEMLAEAQGDTAVAVAHYQYGSVLLQEALYKHKDELLLRAHEEFTKALTPNPNFPAALVTDGRALAHLKQDDAAKARFEAFVKLRPADDPDRQRALLYIRRPELARARMAPPFVITTTDGQQLSLDSLAGKVVLIDFWATWCGPCREALPHIKSIAKKFEGQPLVVLSVSLDSDEQKWKEFIAKQQMTWPQYYGGGFSGTLAKLFGVDAIPHTFTIDADGVLQDEHIGDADIEGKLKKLVAQAREQSSPKAN